MKININNLDFEEFDDEFVPIEKLKKKSDNPELREKREKNKKKRPKRKDNDDVLF